MASSKNDYLILANVIDRSLSKIGKSVKEAKQNAIREDVLNNYSYDPNKSVSENNATLIKGLEKLARTGDKMGAEFLSSIYRDDAKAIQTQEINKLILGLYPQAQREALEKRIKDDNIDLQRTLLPKPEKQTPTKWKSVWTTPMKAGGLQNMHGLSGIETGFGEDDYVVAQYLVNEYDPEAAPRLLQFYAANNPNKRYNISQINSSGSITSYNATPIYYTNENNELVEIQKGGSGRLVKGPDGKPLKANTVTGSDPIKKPVKRGNYNDVSLPPLPGLNSESN